MDADERGSSGRNRFKEVFKFYKRRNTALDFSTMYDLHQFYKPNQEWLNLNLITKHEVGIDWETYYGMPIPKDWFVFTFSSKPGLLYIRNPFNPMVEKYWIARCLKDFTRKPNRLNIDSHKIIDEGDDWWEYCQRECNKDDSNSALQKLRWATMGYHYNWDTKGYSPEARNEFPRDLRSMCEHIGKVFGFQDFNAQAGIVNLYHKGSCLHGHTDHSELNLDAPLFSLSFGQSALFLIGGKSENDEPLRLIVKSGDIIIMSKESRLCFHGVPRIVECKKKTWNDKIHGNEKVLNSPILNKGLLNDVMNEEFWNPFDSYVNKSRINLNVRQVF